MSKHVEGIFDNKRIPVDEYIATCCSIVEYDKNGNTIAVTSGLCAQNK
jgi:hypothetical protein